MRRPPDFKVDLVGVPSVTTDCCLGTRESPIGNCDLGEATPRDSVVRSSSFDCSEVLADVTETS